LCHPEERSDEGSPRYCEERSDEGSPRHCEERSDEGSPRHCEERSDEAIHIYIMDRHGRLRGLAMTN